MPCCAYLACPRFAAPAVLWLVVVLTAACSKEAPLLQQQVVDVTAMTIEPRDAPVVYEFVGQTQSSREVEIRAPAQAGRRNSAALIT